MKPRSTRGLPAWMLGMLWSTSERMADNQSEIVLQDSRTRFERRLPGLNTIVETWLRGRGLTWKPGDWKLTQELPSLRDEVKRAQARFLDAQTSLMLAGAGVTPATVPGTAPGAGGDEQPPPKMFHVDPEGGITFFDAAMKRAGAPPAHRCKAANDEAEPFAEDDPALPVIEQRAIDGLQALWHTLRDDVLAILGLDGGTKTEGPIFVFDVLDMLRRLIDRGELFAKTLFNGITQQIAGSEKS